jgi:nucleoredoxin
MLSVLYDDRTDADEIEVVFVSADSDLDGFNEYYADMPWLAVPFENRAKESELSGKFGVEGIPALIVVDGEGNLVTKDGRTKVTAAKKLNGVAWA